MADRDIEKDFKNMLFWPELRDPTHISLHTEDIY
jgi:hypothetical protein